ncbi:hypothetical protein BCV71DRAFT_234370 [Rhizopus microsporus]|uniref:Uncharacterized protein n=1 Tax=Rhizopus microsporus TaxID=58291 RepID=A0A1X0S437_RHIZD|nr:hypothetical protein BCV71DRAFT_234370 [Rhizopus microsporus]
MSLHSQLNRFAIIVCEYILLIPQFCVIQCSHQHKVNYALGTLADRLIHAICRTRAIFRVLSKLCGSNNHTSSKIQGNNQAIKIPHICQFWSINYLGLHNFCNILWNRDTNASKSMLNISWAIWRGEDPRFSQEKLP